MTILIMLAGAVIFCCGFFVGKHNKTDGKEQYMRLYGRTNGLMEPVRRGGKK